MVGSNPVSLVIVASEAAPVEAVVRAFANARTPLTVRAVPTLAELRADTEAAPPDIVLVNLEPPCDRSLEALAVELVGCPFPVVVMTSRCDERTALAVVEAGAVDYVIASPEGLAEVPHAVVRALREWQLPRARERGGAGAVSRFRSAC